MFDSHVGRIIPLLGIFDSKYKSDGQRGEVVLGPKMYY